METGASGGTTRWFYAALAATLVFRFWLAAVAPVTADEAYFILWGRNPALGYYDHPPMIGWLLAPLASVSEAPWLMRLPAVVVPALVALGVRATLAAWFGAGEAKANLAGLAVLLAPLNVWNVLITTDTPLILFGAASMLAFLRGVQRNSSGWFFSSGLLLGLAFLSKYFAVLLGLAFLVHCLTRRTLKPFFLVFAGGLPFGLLNLYWNYEACWCNVMFNAINRHDDAGLAWSTPLLYAAALAYFAAPLFWYAWRERARLGWEDPARRALVLAWVVPLTVFAVLSPVKRIGLHWLLSFLPALALSVALALDARRLGLAVRFFAVLAAAHVLAAAVAAALPLELWQRTRLYARIVFPGRIAELLEGVAPDARGKVLTADSYAAAALLSYHTKEPVPVFGVGTSHARQNDLATDWRGLDGKDLVVLRREAPAADEYRPYFRSVETKRLPLGGGAYHAVIGTGFDYAAYRTRVLGEVRERYYRIPRWLPVGHCYFFERYFPK
ncbi:MAG TPA: glycosyltransferase family 39 protein [Burkholderiales bacterium]|nr:glycosyltransferase family 39 protein [Burkholderiales bacterium]